MLARLRLLVVAMLLIVLAPMPAAWAHAQLLSTEPGENAVLDQAPATVALIFNEPVSPLALKLIGPDGAASDVEATGGATVTAALPANLPRGTHVLSYRVVSTDGHPIGGSLIFSIGEATGAAATSTGDPAVTTALWVGKIILFIAMFVGIGGGAFLALGDLPARARSLATGLCVVGLVAAVVTLGLQGLDALGLSLSSIFDGAAWSAAFATSYGVTVVVVGIAFLVALGALRMPPDRMAATLGVVAGVLAALSLALSGHASAAEPQWLTRPTVFVHIGGVLFWIGSLFPLFLLLRDKSTEADLALSRFSRGIPYAVAPLVLSGIVLAIIQMGPPGPQWVTGYGLILAAKLGFLIGLFSLALWNRRFLTAPTLAGDEATRSQLRASIGIEMAVVVIILALVAGWRFTPPPRALAAAPPAVAAEPLMIHAEAANTMAMITVTPGQAGPVTVDVLITDLEGMPKDVQSVSLTLASPALGIEPFKRDAIASEDGWQVPDLTIPLAGDWQVELEARVSRFELAKFQAEMTLP